MSRDTRPPSTSYSLRVTRPNALPAQARLRSKSAVDAAFKAGARVHGGLMTLVGRRAGESTRLAVACGKRFSKLAVERNRFRRLTREAYRLTRSTLPAGLDLVVLPKCKPGVATLEALRAELPSLARRLVKKLEAAATSPAPAARKP